MSEMIICASCHHSHRQLPPGMTHPYFNIIKARRRTTCNLPSCKEKFQLGVPICCIGHNAWFHVPCAIEYKVQLYTANDFVHLRTQIDKFALDSDMATIFHKRLETRNPSIFCGAPGSGKSTSLIAFVKLVGPAVNETYVYNADIAQSLRFHGVPHAKTFHSAALSALRSTTNALGLMHDNVDTDIGELLDETGDEIEVCNLKVLSLINSRYPPPSIHALTQRETRMVLLSLETVLFSSAVNSTYILALQNGIGLPGFAPLHDRAAWEDIITRYETDVDIEKRFTSGLTVAQREHCCTHYPDADARKEALIDLCIWVATAACAYLETGEVGPQESRLGPVAALARVWWLTPQLTIMDIGRGKIMYVETLHFNVKWELQPFRYFMARFEVDEFQDMSPLFFEFLKHIMRANDTLRGHEPKCCVDFYGDPRQAINGHNGAMANATEVIRTHWPSTVMLGKTVSERLPKTVIDFVMETLVRPHREVFAINDLTEEILPAPGALPGAILNNQPLAGRLPFHPPYTQTHGILYRNNKEGRMIFNMLLKRGFDAGLRLESKTITTRAMLLQATDMCEKLNKFGLDEITVWSHDKRGAQYECLRESVWRVQQQAGDGLVAAASPGSGLQRLVAYVERTYQEKPPILLYTGHAAKGLEFDVVHIANYSLLPSKRALEAGGLKLEQEYKVMFVMLTRTRDTLSFLAEPEEPQVLEDVLFPEPLIFSPNKRARAAEAVTTVVTTAAAATLERSMEVQHGVDAALELLGLEAMPTSLEEVQAAGAACEEAALQTVGDPEVAAARKAATKAALKVLRRQLLTRATSVRRELVLT